MTTQDKLNRSRKEKNKGYGHRKVSGITSESMNMGPAARPEYALEHTL